MQQFHGYKAAPNVDATDKQRGLMTAAFAKSLNTLSGYFTSSTMQALSLLLDPPRARVTRTTTQSVPSGVYTAISFDTVRYNSAGSSGGSGPFSLSSPTVLRVPAGAGGIYDYGYTLFIPNVSTVGVRLAAARRNGNDAYLLSATSGAATNAQNIVLSGHGQWNFAANDYIELVFFQNTGGALSVGAAGDFGYTAELWLSRRCAP